MTTSPPGRTTFRIAAVFYVISAVTELLGLQAETLLFGAMLTGAPVVVYHLIYVVLFAWLAFALWTGHRSGLHVLLAATVFYSVDRLQLLFAREALSGWIQQGFAGHEDMLQMVGLDYILSVMAIMIVTFVFCWWGFVVYAYVRRAYFGMTPSSNNAEFKR